MGHQDRLGLLLNYDTKRLTSSSIILEDTPIWRKQRHIVTSSKSLYGKKKFVLN